jgi:hypothetical protein
MEKAATGMPRWVRFVRNGHCGRAKAERRAMYAGQWRVYQDAKGIWHWRRETVSDLALAWHANRDLRQELEASGSMSKLALNQHSRRRHE